MHPVDQNSATIDRKEKKGRTPLKQTAVPQPVAQAPMRVVRRRKRIGGKRTVRSCTSCRAAHLRCVADRYGVPCERCAKKSDESEDFDPSMLEVDILEQILKKIASDALAVMAEEMEVDSP